MDCFREQIFYGSLFIVSIHFLIPELETIQYDSTNGFVIVRSENQILCFTLNALNGSMKLVGTGAGGYFGLAYIPTS